MNTFDIDGVIYMGKDHDGVYPGPNDLIITGRSIEEKPETIRMLQQKGINNKVYFNPLPFKQKTRESSGHHKADIISALITLGCPIDIHFEDDPIQADIIKKVTSIHVVLLNHNLTEKENMRHGGY
jgi:hypothetical protein